MSRRRVKPPKPVVIKSFALLAQALSVAKPVIDKPEMKIKGDAVSFSVDPVTTAATAGAPVLGAPHQAVEAQPLTASVKTDKPPDLTVP